MSEPSIKDFETALAELDALVKKLEEGELSLEQSLALYEAGDSDPSASALLLIAKALEVSIDALLEHRVPGARPRAPRVSARHAPSARGPAGAPARA